MGAARVHPLRHPDERFTLHQRRESSAWLHTPRLRATHGRDEPIFSHATVVAEAEQRGPGFDFEAHRGRPVKAFACTGRVGASVVYKARLTARSVRLAALLA